MLVYYLVMVNQYIGIADMRYMPLINFPTKTKYQVYVDSKLVLTTFDPFAAEVEKRMACGKVEVKLTKVSK